MPASPRSNRPVFVCGYRTPFARSNGALADLSSYDLARIVLKGLITRSGLPLREIDEVIIGSVVQNVKTTNVAREAALAAGIPASVPAQTVTMACISSNQACSIGMDRIIAEQARFVIVGGTESLSDVPMLLQKSLRRRLLAARKARSAGAWFSLLRGLRPSDLLPEVPAIEEYSTGKTMGQSGEELAALFRVPRDEQDAFALSSHRRAHEAWEAGEYTRQVVPVVVAGREDPLRRDNGIRPDTSAEVLASLPPAFVKPQGTLTAGNSSFLTDGASAALIASDDAARGAALRPWAFLGAYAYVAQKPDAELLLGPAFAIPRVLERAGLTLADVDVFEMHEAFAGQVLAVVRALASTTFARDRLGRDAAVGEIPADRLNSWGGSLSLGHPFAATGVRLITTAAQRLIAEDGHIALVSACAAGGLGTAMILERHPDAPSSISLREAA